MSHIGWGILGTAKIAVEQVIPAIQGSRRGRVVAIASRSRERAVQAAGRFDVARACDSYEGLLTDPQVDAIYNPLPNHLHVPWSIRALEAGKHVLCEKPLAPTAAEAQMLVEAGRRHPRLKLMEGFMYRHHPQWLAAQRLVQEGRIGELRAVQTAFFYFDRDPASICNQAQLGGGAMLDIGCYPVSLSRWLFDSEPRAVTAQVERDPQFQVDRLVSGLMTFGTGQASFVVSTQLAPYQHVQILGTSGRIEIEIPFNAPSDRPTRIWHQTDAGLHEISFPACNQYGLQSDLFAAAILDSQPVPTPIEDGLVNMQVIEALLRAGRTGHWERVS